MNAHRLQLSNGVAKALQFSLVDLGRCPGREEHLGPALGLKPSQHTQRIFFVEDLLKLILAQGRVQRGHVALGLPRLIALARLLFKLPAKPRCKPYSADHARRVIDEAVVGNQPKFAVFKVGNTVEWIHQKAVRAFVQGDSHRVGCEVAATQIVENVRGLEHGLARFGIGSAKRRPDLQTNATREVEVQRLRRLVFADKRSPSLLEVFLKLGCVALNCEIKIADGRSGRKVTDSSSDQEDRHGAGAGGFAHVLQSRLLCRG